ncbi:putative DNA binding domain-containing protein [Clostridium sp. CX1]|uniref:DNA binding domain-containing protein n=1 Tax=Clostridium tanneri TaxID=3037988 RepID=A0ABU4JPF7_9CLOT|nr:MULTISPECIES: RNA-binding domain-containing protein [unclassified Clostridium]MCT8976374.1 putative DNA binding domain-containing protein [Clostridium sp. CX1]MDW8800038.1 putative DNA binding domain-containing protein [Clostridium sp. A1-XYC3]
MDKKKLANLLKKIEGPKLDFKQSIQIETDSGRRELAKDICAIANSKGGRGYLIIGIEDKTKKVIGIEDFELSEEKIQQIVSSRIDPPIPISLEVIEFQNKKVAIINVYDGPQKPYQLRDNGAFYVRRGSTNDTMRKQEIVSALQENFMLNAELCPIPGSNLSCIDNTLVDKYFFSQGIKVDDDNRVGLMESASIIYMDKDSGKYMVTLGGLLVFCKNNSIYVPHNMIKIINKVNTNFDNTIVIHGDLLTMLNSSEKLLRDILVKSYPVEAVNEGIKNAILYRDYTMFNKIIEVIINYNSIIITSPGILVKGNNTGYINYVKRNMWIYEKVIALDDKSKFIKSGKGFSRMKNAFKRKGKVNFINSIEDGDFKVIYPGVKKFD